MIYKVNIRKGREPLLGAAVGKKGVGKTHTTKQTIREYLMGNPQLGIKRRRVLILDVNDEFSDIKSIAVQDILKFSNNAIIEARRVRIYKPEGGKMTLNEIANTLFFILEYYRNGLLLIEDINKYVSDSLPNDLIGAICTQRHQDVDIIMHFQSIGRITPKIWGNLNWLRFHKNSESVERHKNKYPDKVEILKIAEAMVNNEFEKGNSRFYCYVNLDDEIIEGAYSQKMLDSANVRYIEENYAQVIKPMLNRVSILENKTKKLTQEEAIKIKRAKLFKEYYQGNKDQ